MGSQAVPSVAVPFLVEGMMTSPAFFFHPSAMPLTAMMKKKTNNKTPVNRCTLRVNRKTRARCCLFSIRFSDKTAVDLMLLTARIPINA
jgi:hypothetical protein